jgi:colanic acid/amylovoran biosynthesis protein
LRERRRLLRTFDVLGHHTLGSAAYQHGEKEQPLMSTYGIIGGTLWGNRGAEAMVVTTIGRVRERDPDASFVLLSYFPDRDRELLTDPRITVVDARPRPTAVTWFGALLSRIVGLVGLRLSNAMLPSPVRELRRCRVLFDVSGISFHDGRLTVVAYNLLCIWPALLLRVPVIRLSQAMGPFRHPLNRMPARWVTRRSLHTFARGRLTAEFMAGLGVPSDSWSVAPDVAFAYEPRFSLTKENEQQVTDLGERLTGLRSSGIDVVGLVPSSLVNQKMTKEGQDYVGLLVTLVRDLQQRGVHVLVMPNATRAGVDVPRNNDISVINQLRDRVSSEVRIDPTGITYVDYDLNTASIRSLTDQCELLITSRFHAMVAALALGVPPLVMGWSHKYEEVLEMFGCEGDAVDFSEAEERLPQMVEQLLAERDSTRERILKALPEVTTAAVAQFDQLDRLPAR